MRKIASLLLSIIFAILVLPAMITMFYGGKPVETLQPAISPQTSVVSNEQWTGQRIKVIEAETEEVKELDFEEYIIGVVAAEMNASFEEEALKAQAVAARTYALKKLEQNKGNPDLKGADISTDIVTGQAYQTVDQLKQRWGENFQAYYDRIRKAVASTQGEIIVYENELIEAVFHSTSAGMTESSGNVWRVDVPYLRSVESKQDEKAPNFITDKRIDEQEVIGKLQKQYADLSISDAPLLQQIQVIERTEAGYIKSIQIGNKVLTGAEVRNILDLRSSNFTIGQEGNTIIFTTKGYGHGAGMSQYGANFMAQQGHTYTEILKHYYQGVEIIKQNP